MCPLVFDVPHKLIQPTEVQLERSFNLPFDGLSPRCRGPAAGQHPSTTDALASPAIDDAFRPSSARGARAA